LIDSLTQFVGILRQSGVRVSVAETADAVRVLRHLPLSQREVVRLGLRSALIKESRHFGLFERLFAEHFSVRVGSDSQGDGERGESEESQGGAQGSAGAGQGEGQAASSESTSRKDDSDEAAGTPQSQDPPNSQQDSQQDSDAESDTGSDKGDKAEAAESSEEVAGEAENGQAAEAARLLARLQMGAGHPSQAPGSDAPVNSRAANESAADLARAQVDLRRRLPPDTTGDLYAAVEVLAARLATRQSRRYRAARRGAMDMKRTVQAGFRRGEQPAVLKRKRRKIDRRQLVVLCDISGSVHRVSRFFLKLVHQMQDQFSRTRSFVFVDRLVETTELFAQGPFDKALDRLEKDRQFNLFGRSDYGRALYQFYDEYLPSLSRKTVLVVLGDARNNHFEPLEWTLEEASRRVHTLLWLNPDARREWDRDDSVVSAYAPYCDRVLECRNLRQLEEAGRLLLRR
jgi:uncharacterized protein